MDPRSEQADVLPATGKDHGEGLVAKVKDEQVAHVPSRGGEDNSLSVKGRLLVEETTLERVSPREKGAMARRLAAVKTLERTCWQFFFVLPRPARVAERVGTEMAQLDGKVLILVKTALRVELTVKIVVILAEMVDVVLKMVVKPQYSLIFE